MWPFKKKTNSEPTHEFYKYCPYSGGLFLGERFNGLEMLNEYEGVCCFYLEGGFAGWLYSRFPQHKGWSYRPLKTNK